MVPCYIVHQHVNGTKVLVRNRVIYIVEKGANGCSWGNNIVEGRKRLKAENRIESLSCCRRAEGETQDQISGHPLTDKTHR